MLLWGLKMLTLNGQQNYNLFVVIQSVKHGFFTQLQGSLCYQIVKSITTDHQKQFTLHVPEKIVNVLKMLYPFCLTFAKKIKWQKATISALYPFFSCCHFFFYYMGRQKRYKLFRVIFLLMEHRIGLTILILTVFLQILHPFGVTPPLAPIFYPPEIP